MDETGYKVKLSEHGSNVIEQLNIQRCKGELCDVMVIIDRLRFPAHKCILCAASSKFTHLINGLKPSSKDLLIDEISPQGFKVLLDFIYSGSLWIPADCLEDVYTTAVFLEMGAISQLCERISTSSCSETQRASHKSQKTVTAGQQCFNSDAVYECTQLKTCISAKTSRGRFGEVDNVQNVYFGSQFNKSTGIELNSNQICGENVGVARPGFVERTILNETSLHCHTQANQFFVPPIEHAFSSCSELSGYQNSPTVNMDTCHYTPDPSDTYRSQNQSFMQPPDNLYDTTGNYCSPASEKSQNFSNNSKPRLTTSKIFADYAMNLQRTSQIADESNIIMAGQSGRNNMDDSRTNQYYLVQDNTLHAEKTTESKPVNKSEQVGSCVQLQVNDSYPEHYCQGSLSSLVNTDLQSQNNLQARALHGNRCSSKSTQKQSCFSEQRPAARMPPKKAGYRGGVMTAGDYRSPMSSVTASQKASEDAHLNTGIYVNASSEHLQRKTVQENHLNSSQELHLTANQVGMDNVQERERNFIPRQQTSVSSMDCRTNTEQEGSNEYLYNHEEQGSSSTSPNTLKIHKKCVPKHQHFRQRYEATLALEELDSDLGIYIANEKNTTDDPNLVFYDIEAGREHNMPSFEQDQPFIGTSQQEIYTTDYDNVQGSFHDNRNFIPEKDSSTLSESSPNSSLTKILQTPTRNQFTDYFEEYLKDVQKNLSSASGFPTTLASSCTSQGAPNLQYNLNSFPPNISVPTDFRSEQQQRFNDNFTYNQCDTQKLSETNLPSQVSYNSTIASGHYQSGTVLPVSFQGNNTLNYTDEDMSKSFFQLLRPDSGPDLPYDGLGGLDNVNLPSNQLQQHQRLNTNCQTTNLSPSCGKTGRKPSGVVQEVLTDLVTPSNLNLPQVDTEMPDLRTVMPENEAYGLVLEFPDDVPNTTAELRLEDTYCKKKLYAPIPNPKTKRQLSFNDGADVVNQNQESTPNHLYSFSESSKNHVSNVSSSSDYVDNVESTAEPSQTRNQMLSVSGEDMAPKRDKESCRAQNLTEKEAGMSHLSRPSIQEEHLENASPEKSQSEILKPFKKRIRVGPALNKDLLSSPAVKQNLQTQKRLRKMVYTCLICEREFGDSQIRYKEHMTAHENMQQGALSLLFCEVCGAAYQRQEDLTRHKSKVHPSCSFQCPNCQESFANPQVFKKHCLVHGETKPFACAEAGCNFRTNVFYLLEKHSTGHGAEKHIICTACTRKFPHYDALRKHEMSCFDKQQYSCDACPKTFNRTQALKSHKLAVHSELRSFSCKHCSSLFSNARNLKRHMLIHSDQQPYTCPQCSQKFRHSNALKRHLQKLHNQKIETGVKGGKNDSNVFVACYSSTNPKN